METNEMQTEATVSKKHKGGAWKVIVAVVLIIGV